MSRDFGQSETDRYEVGMDHFQRPGRVSSRHSDDELVDGVQVRSQRGTVLVTDYEHAAHAAFVRG
ncbi:hypothetical protein [Micromonospora sp. NPDC000668]|uniref:hypothetical protein n=1 Tax=Micromonospora sp. NPDC000668 TaxID=3364219 RepID=UPI003685D99D